MPLSSKTLSFLRCIAQSVRVLTKLNQLEVSIVHQYWKTETEHDTNPCNLYIQNGVLVPLQYFSKLSLANNMNY